MLNAIGINPIVSFDTANALYISGWVLTSYLFDCPQNSRTFLYFHSLNVPFFASPTRGSPPRAPVQDYTLQECPGSPLALGSTADDALTATQKGGDFRPRGLCPHQWLLRPRTCDATGGRADGLEFADDGIGPTRSFGHLNTLALDHLGGSPGGNDSSVFGELPPSGAASRPTRA
jgi:hypothetical protein